MTASAALSGANVTALRAGNDDVKRYLAIVPATEIATARINQASIASPHAGYVVDNTSAGWLNGTAGMTAWIGTTAGARDIGVYRLRHDNDTNVLFLNEMSLGDPGLLSLSSLLQAVDNAYVTIYQDRNIWSAFPAIVYGGGVDARSGTFYKDNDTSYVTQNETTPAFALNIGGHFADDIDPSTAVITESRTAEVYVWLAGTTVSSYLWDVGDGTITVGTTTTQSITVTYPAGYREISCTVTLSTGVVRTVYRSVWARNPASVTNHLDIEILSDRRDMLGRVMRFRAIDSLGALANGAMAMYWEDASWNGSDIASASKSFVGWVRSISGTRDPDTSSQEFELVSAMHVLAELKAFSQVVVVNADPDNWQEIIAGLGHLDYWIFYLLHYHTTVLSLFDYEIANLTTLLTKAWQVGNGSWASVLNQAGARVNASVGQRSDGTIFVRRNPQLMSQSDRDAVIERMTLTEADAGAIEIARTLRPRSGKVKASAFAYDGTESTPYLANAPGNVSGQSANEASLDDQLVTSATPQDELNERAANEFARLNNPYDTISVPIPLNYDVFEPAEQYWVRLTVAAAYMPDGVAFNRRCLVRAVTVNHEPSSKSVQLELEVETSGIGAPAQTVPVGLPDITENAGFVAGNSYFPQFGFDPLTGIPTLNYNPYQTPNYTTPPTSLPTNEYMAAWLGQYVVITNDRGAASPAWTVSLDAGSGWEIQDVIQAAGSTANALRLSAVAWHSGSNASRIYYNSDVTGSGIWQLKQELSATLIQTIHHVAGVSNGWILKNNPSSGFTGALYTSDNWSTYNEITAVAAGSGDPRFDVDDFNLGILVMGIGTGVYYTTSYADASMTALVGVTASSTAGNIRFVRIPYFLVDDGTTLNNDPTALQFVIGVNTPVAGATIWLVTFNSSTGAIVTQTDITPIIATVTYFVNGRDNLSTAGGNSQIILAAVRPVGTSDPDDLILSEDGGATWEIVQGAYSAPTWVDGSSTTVALTVSAGLAISLDRGRTLIDQTGDIGGTAKGIIIPN